MVTYFDAKLPPLISEPLRRPFSTQYFVESPKKPTQTELAIYQQGSRPPYYQLIVNGEIHQLPPVSPLEFIESVIDNLNQLYEI